MLEDNLGDSEPKKDLSDKVLGKAKLAANIFVSAFTHPNETTELDLETGNIIRHYKPSKAERIAMYSLPNLLKRMYLISKESLLHPTQDSCIRETTYIDETASRIVKTDYEIIRH